MCYSPRGITQRRGNAVFRVASDTLDAIMHARLQCRSHCAVARRCNDVPWGGIFVALHDDGRRRASEADRRFPHRRSVQQSIPEKGLPQQRSSVGEQFRRAAPRRAVGLICILRLICRGRVPREFFAPPSSFPCPRPPPPFPSSRSPSALPRPRRLRGMLFRFFAAHRRVDSSSSRGIIYRAALARSEDPRESLAPEGRGGGEGGIPSVRWRPIISLESEIAVPSSVYNPRVSLSVSSLAAYS
jgi:hypothetical protein